MAHIKQSTNRTRATCTSSTPPPQARQQTSATYLWPREQEGEPIDLDSPLLLDFNCEDWDKGTTARYNALLRVDMLPTRFCHAETLADLGIDEDVFGTLHAIGIAPLCYTTHELYPDLARQVLATATITYEDSNAPSYANCSFSFMADGEYCSLSLNKLNEIYETATEPKGVAVAKKFSPSNAFWDCIANGNFTPGKAYQSQIRNPALRVIAKTISNLLFAKDLTSKVTNGELQALYAGIEDEIRASGSGILI
uniref:Arabidopsis retrotransposon Orf1 C-terminal domain-containing protein n=2 Tax=Brassica oleracea var. oleracea TaxID=109376 RepID=A0A0D3ALL7_BRAOL